MPDLNRSISEGKVVSYSVVIYMTFVSLSSTMSSNGLCMDIFDGKPNNDLLLQHTIQHITFAKQLDAKKKKGVGVCKIPNLYWLRRGTVIERYQGISVDRKQMHKLSS